MRDAQTAERVMPLTGRMAAKAQVSVMPAEPAFRLSLPEAWTTPPHAPLRHATR